MTRANHEQKPYFFPYESAKGFIDFRVRRTLANSNLTEKQKHLIQNLGLAAKMTLIRPTDDCTWEVLRQFVIYTRSSNGTSRKK